jgi:hypothetical protein
MHHDSVGPNNASFFAIGEVGGAFSAGGSGTQTDTSTINLTVDLTQLASRQDLELGLFSGQSAGSGFSNLNLTVVADGNTLINQNFNQANAITEFTNKAIDLGSLSSGILSGNTLTLTITTTLVTTSAGTNFYGGFLVGDPPPGGGGASGGAAAAALANLGQAAASFTSGGGANVGGSSSALPDNDTPQLANPNSHAVT